MDDGGGGADNNGGSAAALLLARNRPYGYHEHRRRPRDGCPGGLFGARSMGILAMLTMLAALFGLYIASLHVNERRRCPPCHILGSKEATYAQGALVVSVVVLGAAV